MEEMNAKPLDNLTKEHLYLIDVWLTENNSDISVVLIINTPILVEDSSEVNSAQYINCVTST